MCHLFYKSLPLLRSNVKAVSTSDAFILQSSFPQMFEEIEQSLKLRNFEDKT